MRKHITAIGLIYLALGVFGLLAAAAIWVFTIGPGLIGFFVGDSWEALLALTLIGGAATLIAVLVAMPAFVGGIRLLKRKPWARVLVSVLSIPVLFKFPVGTALGAYSLWALVLEDETAELFAAA
jgi:hypothetical protein